MENKKFRVHVAAILTISNTLTFLERVRANSPDYHSPENTIGLKNSPRGMVTDLVGHATESLRSSFRALREAEHPEEELTWIRSSLLGLSNRLAIILQGWEHPVDLDCLRKEFAETIEKIG